MFGFVVDAETSRGKFGVADVPDAGIFVELGTHLVPVNDGLVLAGAVRPTVPDACEVLASWGMAQSFGRAVMREIDEADLDRRILVDEVRPGEVMPSETVHVIDHLLRNLETAERRGLAVDKVSQRFVRPSDASGFDCH